MTGAAEEDGFGGLAGGHGSRRALLSFEAGDGDGITYRFERTDNSEKVCVTYHVSDVPETGPVARYLPKLIEGEATASEREAFTEAWHGRVRTVLTDDDLFEVELRAVP